MNPPDHNRRPLKTRSTGWARQGALFLARTAITPNQISVASVGVALMGAALLLGMPTPFGLVGCAVCVQLRLLCNLLDGMVAIEGRKASPLGVLYNEFPDRIADTLFLVALGYAISLPWIGWLGALAAVSTAYVRVFAGSLGFAQDFRGPMAKQHRMAVLTIGCLGGAIERALVGTHSILLGAACIIAIGALVTCVTRTLALVKQLQQR